VITPLGPVGSVDGHALVESRLLVQAPRSSLAGATTPVTFEVLADGKVVETISSSFIGPEK
jgi:hypothetical protein